MGFFGRYLNKQTRSYAYNQGQSDEWRLSRLDQGDSDQKDRPLGPSSTLVESSDAHDQSITSACPRRFEILAPSFLSRRL
jgi:hypothetical protein